jgi:hypothetical protein
MNEDKWEYFQVRKFYDPFGQELPGETCEYCNKAQPVELFETQDGMKDPFRNPAHRKILMKQVKINDRVQWICLDCLKDLDQSI